MLTVVIFGIPSPSLTGFRYHKLNEAMSIVPGAYCIQA